MGQTGDLGRGLDGSSHCLFVKDTNLTTKTELSKSHSPPHLLSNTPGLRKRGSSLLGFPFQGSHTCQMLVLRHFLCHEHATLRHSVGCPEMRRVSLLGAKSLEFQSSTACTPNFRKPLTKTPKTYLFPGDEASSTIHPTALTPHPRLQAQNPSPQALPPAYPLSQAPGLQPTFLLA